MALLEPHGPLVGSSHWWRLETESPRRTSQTQEGGSTTPSRTGKNLYKHAYHRLTLFSTLCLSFNCEYADAILNRINIFNH